MHPTYWLISTQVDAGRAVDVAGVRRVGLEVVDLRERVDDPVTVRLPHGKVQALLPRLEGGGLDQRDLEVARDRGLDARAVELRVTLCHVRLRGKQPVSRMRSL